MKCVSAFLQETIIGQLGPRAACVCVMIIYRARWVFIWEDILSGHLETAPKEKEFNGTLQKMSVISAF